MDLAIKQAKALARKIKKHLAEGNEWRGYFDYSGRCMFGRTCFGIIVGRYDVEDVQKKYKGVSVDNLGLDYICYWPSVSGELMKPLLPELCKDEEDDE
jgi:hypothetical protein